MKAFCFKFRDLVLFFALLIGTSFGVSGAHAGIEEERGLLKQELQSLFHTIETNYGPLELKRELIGLDWEATKAGYLASVDQLIDTRQFYFLVSKLLSEFKDVHVNIGLPSTWLWKLPLQFSAVGDKVILTWGETEYLIKTKCPIRIGDRLVGINGFDLEQVRARHPIFSKYTNDATNRMSFARGLNELTESSGLPLSFSNPYPRSSRFTFVTRESGQQVDCDLWYMSEGFPILGRSLKSNTANDGLDQYPYSTPVPVAPQKKTIQGPASVQAGLAQLARALGGDQGAETSAHLKRAESILRKVQILVDGNGAASVTNVRRHRYGSGMTRPEGDYFEMEHFFPSYRLHGNIGVIEPPFADSFTGWIKGEELWALTFEYGGKKIGIMRIPSYMPKSILGGIIAIRYYLRELEARTDYLILDQLDNPGGSALLADFVVQSLVGKIDDSKHMKFRVKPTQSFMRQFADVIGELSQDDLLIPAEVRKELIAEARASLKLIHEAYVTKSNLSAPIPLHFMVKVYQALIDASIQNLPWKGFYEWSYGPVFKPVHYTKPVFVLTNELDFSAADATPAMLQDYGRAKIVGTRTGGAGGTVEVFKSDVLNGFLYSLTTSLMVRGNGAYVENLGVQPDIEFTSTEEDYIDGHKTYLPRLLKTILPELPPEFSVPRGRR